MPRPNSSIARCRRRIRSKIAPMADPGSLLLLVGAILVVLGIAGTVVPAIPGVPLVFVGLLVAAWADHFQKVGWFTLSILALLTLGSFVLDFFATAMGAKRVSELAGAGPLGGRRDRGSLLQHPRPDPRP